MLTKRKIIILAITGVMAAMVTGGVVMAQDGSTQEDSSRETMGSRVTTILNLEDGVNLEVEVVQDALKQARTAIKDERFEMKLQKLVELGHLDQEQADELREWYESRPDHADGASFGFGKRGGGHSFHGRGTFGSFGGRFGQFHAYPEAPPSDSSGSTTSY